MAGYRPPPSILAYILWPREGEINKNKIKYCIQKTSGYEGSEEHGRKKKCDMEKMMNKKSYFELVFAQHSSGSYVVLMKNNPERY